MMKFLRENPTIFFGIGLPFLLVGVFGIISWLMTVSVERPKYPVLFATGYYPGNGGGVQFEVVNGKLNIALNRSKYYSSTILYLYNPEANQVQEIRLNLPIRTSGAEDQPIQIEVPELKGFEFSTASVSPDGFTFSTLSSLRTSGMFFSDIFFAGTRAGPSLVKDSYRVRIPNHSGRYFYDTQFIGWVVKK